MLGVLFGLYAQYSESSVMFAYSDDSRLMSDILTGQVKLN